jgi:cytochrome P450
MPRHADEKYCAAQARLDFAGAGQMTKVTAMPSVFPPGPHDWTFGLSQLRKLKQDVLGYYTELRRRYGDVVHLRFGPYKTYVFFHPDAVREVLVAKAKQFRRFPRPMQVFAQWNGNSVLISEGDEWLRQRRMVQPAFHQRRFERYGSCMVARTRDRLERWLKTIETAGGIETEIGKEMTNLTLEIIAKTMFDAEISADASDLGRAVAILSDVAVKEIESPWTLPDWLPLSGKRRKRWAMQRLDETVRRFIRERRTSGLDKGDLLSMLLLAVDEEGDGGRFTDEQARDQCMTLLIAGHDTTAAGLTWSFYCLARHPQTAALVHQEVDTVLAGREPTATDLPQLRYTERVVKETLRLYPPAVAVFTRQALADVEIAGYTLPRNSLVQMFPYICQHDSRWFPDPEAFDPDRFLPERQRILPPFAYFPFGGGPRVCIGNSFAMMEMTLVAATLLQHLKVELAAGQGEVRPVALVSLRPECEVKLRWNRREERSVAAEHSSNGLLQQTCRAFGE